MILLQGNIWVQGAVCALDPQEVLIGTRDALGLPDGTTGLRDVLDPQDVMIDPQDAMKGLPDAMTSLPDATTGLLDVRDPQDVTKDPQDVMKGLPDAKRFYN